MKQSDWKKFNTVKEKALEALCQRILNQAETIINNSSGSAHERYIKLFRYTNNKNKDIANAFDGHSRNRAWAQMLYMRRMELVPDKEIAKFSAEFQAHTNPKPIIRD